jgi:hypothetical protein
MPITVTNPDNNVTVMFPDGVDPETVRAVMSGRFGGAAPKAAPITTNSLVREAATGVPLAGGPLNKLEAGTNALLSYGLNPLFDEKDQLTGSLGERYSKSLAEQNAMDEKFESEHPIASTAAQLAGGTAATLPIAATARGAQLLGMGGQTLAGQVARGATSGAAINAVDAAIRGNDPVMAGITGAGVGGVTPAATRLASAIATPLASTVRGIVNPTAEAERRLGYAINRGQQINQQVPGSALTPQQFGQLAAQGEPVMAADMAGEPGRALMRSAANQSPEARAILNNTIDTRFETQAPRFAADQQTQLNYPTQALRDQAIQDVQQRVYEPAYAQAWGDSRGIPLWPDPELIRLREQDYNTLQSLAQRSQMGPPLNAQERAQLRNLTARGVQNRPPFTPQQLNALQNLRDIAQSPDVQQAIPLAQLMHRNYAVRDGWSPPAPALGIDRSGPTPIVRPTQTKSGNINMPSLQYWDYIKRQLDQMGTPTSPSFARLLRNSLDELVPSYAQARAAAQPTKFFNGAANAYEAGQNFINRGTTFGPDAGQMLNNMDPVERNLFQDGYATSLIDRINNTGDRRTITNRVFNTPNARNEIVTALGPQRANQIEARLQLENLMDTARQAVQGNSTTMRQLVELGLAGGVGLVEGGNPANWDSTTIMHAA